MRFPTTTALFALLAGAATADQVSCSGYQTNPSDAAACADQLTLRGAEICKVTGGFTTTFCQIGEARIVGVGLGNPSGTEESVAWYVKSFVNDCYVVRLLTDTCSLDIAVAVGQILDACTHEVVPYGMKASGEKLANGNPNISVHAVSTYDG
jgi:hypothetical protein